MSEKYLYVYANLHILYVLVHGKHVIPISTFIYGVFTSASVKSFQKPLPLTPKMTFNKIDALVFADLSPLVGPGVLQG